MRQYQLFDYCECGNKVSLDDLRFWGECSECRANLDIKNYDDQSKPRYWSGNGATGIPHKDDEFDMDALGYYNNAKRFLED